MASVYHGRPRLVDPRPAVARAANEACRKLAYRDGVIAECGAPTKGRTYCEDCRTHLVTMLDPPVRVANAPSHKLEPKWRRSA